MYEIDIDHVDLLHNCVVLATGEHVEITDMIAEDGELTVDAREAVVVVGQMASGQWLAAQVVAEDGKPSLQ